LTPQRPRSFGAAGTRARGTQGTTSGGFPYGLISAKIGPCPPSPAASIRTSRRSAGASTTATSTPAPLRSASAIPTARRSGSGAAASIRVADQETAPAAPRRALTKLEPRSKPRGACSWRSAPRRTFKPGVTSKLGPRESMRLGLLVTVHRLNSSTFTHHLRQARPCPAAGCQLEQKARGCDGLSLTAAVRRLPRGDYLHCPFFLRSSIVCRQNETQPCPAPNWGPAFWHLLIQTLASQLTPAASTGGEDTIEIP
jgi:hypothetical protein